MLFTSVLMDPHMCTSRVYGPVYMMTFGGGTVQIVLSSSAGRLEWVPLSSPPSPTSHTQGDPKVNDVYSI